MRNIFRDIKIRKELKEFRKFKDNYQFKMLELDEKEDGGQRQLRIYKIYLSRKIAPPLTFDCRSDRFFIMDCRVTALTLPI